LTTAPLVVKISVEISANPAARKYVTLPFWRCFFMPNLRRWILAVLAAAQTPIKPLVSLTYNLRRWILAVLAAAQT
tara:strand:- start:137 stop:364 length:228 start_codon:yes stop_codon:yes gene_type:complete